MEFSESDALERDEDEDLDIDVSVVHMASSGGDLDILTKVIKQDPTLLEQTDNDGLTPLAHAVLAGQVEAVKILVKMGASINAQDQLGRTCLSMAAYQGWYDGLVFLLRNGAKQNTVDKAGRTPLHASTYDVEPRTMVALLQNISAEELSQQDNEGMTVLHWAAFHNRPKHVQILMERGINVLSKDIDGKTALHWAAQNGSVSCCHQFLSHKSASKLVNLTDYSGKSPVHFAAAAGHSKVIQELAKVEGCDLEIEDPDERVPLHWAAATCQIEAMTTLLALNVDPNPIDAEGGTPLDYARQSGHSACVELLERKLGIERSEGLKPSHQPPKEVETSVSVKSKKNPFGFISNLFKSNKRQQREYNLEISDEPRETVSSSVYAAPRNNNNHHVNSSGNVPTVTHNSDKPAVVSRLKKDNSSSPSPKMEHNLGEIRPSHGRNIPLEQNSNVLPPMKNRSRSNSEQEEGECINSPRLQHKTGSALTSPRAGSMPPDAEAILAAQLGNKRTEISGVKIHGSESLSPLPLNKNLTPLISQEENESRKTSRYGGMLPPATSLVPAEGAVTPRRPSTESPGQLAPLRVPKTKMGSSLPSAVVNKQLAALKHERLGGDRTPTPPPWADLPHGGRSEIPTPRMTSDLGVDTSQQSKVKRKSKHSLDRHNISPKSSRSPDDDNQPETHIPLSPRSGKETDHFPLSPRLALESDRLSPSNKSSVINNRNAGSLTSRSPLPGLGHGDGLSPVCKSPPLEAVADLRDPRKGSLIGRQSSPQREQDHEMLDRCMQNLLH